MKKLNKVLYSLVQDNKDKMLFVYLYDMAKLNDHISARLNLKKLIQENKIWIEMNNYSEENAIWNT